jgi:hypothetical protein
MEIQKYSVYNKTRGTYLSLGVLVIDTTLESFNLLLDNLAEKSEFGLWLTPFRGIPGGHGLRPIDLVYLDEQHRVAQPVESFPTAAFEALKVPAASALALPAHAISSSQTESGDELIICAPEEMERQIALIANAPTPTRVTQSNESAQEKSENMTATNSAPQDNASKKLRSAIRQLEKKEIAAEAEVEEKPSLKTRFLRWLFPDVDRRRAFRSPLQGLVAYYWTGGAPQAYKIGDISTKGVYLLTDERWAPETVILITLQKTDKDEDDPEGAISVQSRVVRWGLDGLGLEFVLSEFIDPNSGEVLSGRAEDKKALEHFLQGLNLPQEAEPQTGSH